MDAFGGRIERGSRLAHDMERSHRRLVRELELEDAAYNSKAVCRMPEAENPLAEVNEQCRLVQRFLRAHSGFRRDNLQGFLDLFSVASNPPEEKMEKVAFVLDRAMHCAKTLRYRDYYSPRPAD